MGARCTSRAPPFPGIATPSRPATTPCRWRSSQDIRRCAPWHRDAFAATQDSLPLGYAPLRHIGLYAYSNAFLQAYPKLDVSPLEGIEALEQLRVLWHGYPIAVHVTQEAPPGGVDTPDDLARVRLHYPS